MQRDHKVAGVNPRWVIPWRERLSCDGRAELPSRGMHRFLEVLAYLAGEAKIDPLRVSVSSVTGKYGSLQFIGQLANSSILLPELREGLNVTIDYNEVRAWRLNSGPPVIRDP